MVSLQIHIVTTYSSRSLIYACITSRSPADQAAKRARNPTENNADSTDSVRKKKREELAGRDRVKSSSPKSMTSCVHIASSSV